MTLRLSMINVSSAYNFVNMNVLNLYNTLHLFQSDNYNLICANLYKGNNLSCKVSSFFTSYDIVVQDFCDYSLSMSFTGQYNFNILLRNSGSIRLSLSLNQHLDANVSSDVLHQTIDNEVYKLFHFCNSTFNLNICTNYYILLINCMVYLPHNIQCTENDTNRIVNGQLFPIVVAPEYIGKRRRKGMIKMYIYSNKKCGVVYVNKSSFQFLGFTKIVDIVETVQKVKLTCLL